MPDEHIIVRHGLYSQTGDKGVCIFIDDRAAWVIKTDPESDTTTITIPGSSRWQVTTDSFNETNPTQHPKLMPSGQPLTAIFFKNGELSPEDDDKRIVFTHKAG